jgi:hypothetical protein
LNGIRRAFGFEYHGPACFEVGNGFVAELLEVALDRRAVCNCPGESSQVRIAGVLLERFVYKLRKGAPELGGKV